MLVAGILYFVALPAYRNSVLHANRAVARGVLYDVLARQEQHFLNHRQYAAELASLGLPSPYYVDRQAQQAGEGDGIYRIELDLVSSVYEGVRAVPHRAQARDLACMSYRIGRTGVRSVTGTLAADPARCW